MFGLKQKFSTRFYLGILLIILGFLIAKAAQVVFFFYFEDPFWRWLAVGVYILSWLMLIVALWWMGKEYSEKLRKYFQYKFYQKAIENKTKRAYLRTREKTRVLGKRFRRTVKSRLEKKRIKKVEGKPNVQ